MARGVWWAAVCGLVLWWPACRTCAGDEQAQEPHQPPSLDEAAAADLPAQPPQEKLARIWANEPPLVRLARDRFGAEFTETDAKFFAAVAANEWADFRPSEDTKFNREDPRSWAKYPALKADRITWLCGDAAACQLVPSRGVWLRGAKISGRIDLYRSSISFALGFSECLLDKGINLRNAKLQELTITDCCSARVDARGVQAAESIYIMRTAVFGGLDFIEAQIAGDLDMNGGLAFHGTSSEDAKQAGLAVDLYDAKVDGDVKLGENFRAIGRVRLTGARIGRSLSCSGGRFAGLGESSIEAHRAQIGRNVTLSGGLRAAGCVDLRRARIGGDLDCNGASLDGGGNAALDADLVDVAGQVHLGDGLHADGEVRFVNAVIAKDVDCDNGHFVNPAGDALSFDSAVIGRSLLIGYDASAPAETETDLPPAFVARGGVRLYGTKIDQDLLAAGGQFETPHGTAILASNLQVGSRLVLSAASVRGMVDLSNAEIEHELDIRGSYFDGSKAYNGIAIWANGMEVRGHVNSHQVDAPEQTWPFRVDGLMSFNFVSIGMSWNLYGAQLHNPAGGALDASDLQVGGYVNLDLVDIDGRVSFSRAKIDGMWILTRVVKPERMTLDMRFAHIWVIKDDKLSDWPPAGQLQLEGFVYDHFDDDSPLSVEDRLAWIRRQYAPAVDAVTPVGPTLLPVPDGKRTDRIARSTKTRGRATAGEIIAVNYEATTGAAAPQMAAPDPNVAPEDDIFPADPSEAAASKPTNGGREGDTPEAVAPSTAAPADPAGRRYITQPYTQLASVYRAIGQDEQANRVLVARAERLGELSPPLSAQGFWYRYLGRLIGYGYEPFRAIKIGAAIVLVGTIVFAIGARRNLMAETKLAEHVLSQENEARLVPSTYPRFNPFVYSLDVFLPFVDLHQLCYWIPGERLTTPRTSRNCLMHIGSYSVKWSGILRTYLWFQTLAGWTLCTLLAAAVTGIVQS